mgnify:CR=1 FL=1
MVKKKISTNNEIDLIELIILIYKNKFKIILFIVLSIVLMIMHLSLTKKEVVLPLFESQTEIRSISTYDEFGYQIYNNFIRHNSSKVIKYPIKSDNETFIVNEIKLDFDDSSFNTIDKDYLINLFIEKLNDKDFIIKTMREFKHIKESNIARYADSFKLSINANTKDRDELLKSKSWLISSKLEAIDKWRDYLFYLEKETNNEVRLYIYKTFQNMIENKKKINKYKIEDIELEIKNTTDEFKIERLKLSRQDILKSRYIERLIFSFQTTPVLDQKSFAAANILTNSTNYNNLSKQTKTNNVPTMLIISIIIGLIIGLFYVIIENSIKKRI